MSTPKEIASDRLVEYIKCRITELEKRQVETEGQLSELQSMLSSFTTMLSDEERRANK